jgi:AraC-like DNA-binding protein
MGVSTEGKESRGSVGSVFIYPPRIAHQESCLSTMDLEMFTAIWKYPSNGDAEKPPREAFDTVGRIAHALGWMEDLQGSLGRRHPMLDKLLQVTLFECSRSQRTPGTSRISLVLAYIQDHLAEPLPIKQLACIACMSESHFAHEFRRQTGLSPISHVRKIRLDRACKAIVQTNLVFREIARSVGFRDEFEFSRVFRRTMGISPSSLRSRRPVEGKA